MKITWTLLLTLLSATALTSSKPAASIPKPGARAIPRDAAQATTGTSAYGTPAIAYDPATNVLAINENRPHPIEKFIR
jgi:hypothetical protein